MEIVDIQHFSDIDGMKGMGFSGSSEFCIELKEVGNDRIVVHGPMYRLRHTKYIVIEGNYLTASKTTNGYIVTSEVSLLYDSSQGIDLCSPVFWEQNGIRQMFHNFVIKQVNSHKDGSIVLLEACVA